MTRDNKHQLLFKYSPLWILQDLQAIPTKALHSTKPLVNPKIYSNFTLLYPFICLKQGAQISRETN